MTEQALSIRAAAEDAPDAPAIIDDEGVVTFAQLAEAIAQCPRGPIDRATPLVARLDRATVVAIVAALEHRTPIGLVPERASAREQAALIARLRAAAVPADTLAVVFTSGSTGRPKGVVLSRAAACAAAAASAARLGWRDDDRWLLALPLAHVGGLAIVVRCLAARRPIVIATGSIAAAIARHRVTLASLVPAQLAALLDPPAWQPPPAVRAILLGGAAAAPALVAAARARGAPVHTTYGMTETFGQVATGDATTPAGAVGPALPGIAIHAGTRAAPAPIAIASAALLTGYLDEPDGRDVPDGDDEAGYLDEPDGDTAIAARRFVTRDLGFVDDGLLHVIGRRDDVIVTGGEKVHPLAVEAALVELPAVAAAVVVGVDDDRWGQLVGAIVVPAPGVDRAGVDRAIRAAAAGWPPHHRPRRLLVVDALPLGPTGKPDRRAAAARLSLSGLDASASPTRPTPPS